MVTFIERLRRKWQLKHPDALLRSWYRKGQENECAKWEAQVSYHSQFCIDCKSLLTRISPYGWECLPCKARHTDPALQVTEYVIPAVVSPLRSSPFARIMRNAVPIVQLTQRNTGKAER